MTLYETWLASAYYRNGRTNERTWADYIPREQAIYEDIIGNKLTSLSGTVTELAERYNVPKAYIAGFVDGINETQPEKIELETLTDDTQINLVIDLEKLYKQMVEYKADHLYSLPQWEDVFTREQLDAFYKEQKNSKTVHNQIRTLVEMTLVLVVVVRSTRSAVEQINKISGVLLNGHYYFKSRFCRTFEGY